jgi:replicative DNA helicase
MVQQLPHNIEAEQALLCSLFISEGEILPKFKERFEPDDFHDFRHKMIVECAYEIGKPFDVARLGEALKRKGYQKDVTIQYVTSLWEVMATWAGWEYWADMVKEHSLRRKMILACKEIEDEFSNLASGKQYAEILQAHKSKIREIEEGHVSDAWDGKKEADLVVDEIRARQRGERKLGYPFGFPSIESQIGGIEPRKLYILGAKSHTGKTAFALQVCDYVSFVGTAIPFFTLESDKISIQFRRIARLARIDLTRVRLGKVYDSEEEELDRALQFIESSSLQIYDHSKYRQLEHLLAKCESLAMDTELRLIVIDHLQLMYSGQKHANRHLEISHISSRLADLAKDLDVPVLVLSQLNEEGQTKESRDTFNNADQMWFMEAPERAEGEDDYRVISSQKGRDTGPFKEIWFSFEGHFMSLTDAAIPPETDDLPF